VRVDHTTVFRWVQCYAPELDKRCRPQLKVTNDSYRVDETYIKIKKQWYYLYRAIDSTGATLDFMLSALPVTPRPLTILPEGAERGPYGVTPRGITVDQHAAYPQPSARKLLISSETSRGVNGWCHGRRS
jgi:transposase, IS6 family